MILLTNPSTNRQKRKRDPSLAEANSGGIAVQTYLEYRESKEFRSRGYFRPDEYSSSMPASKQVCRLNRIAKVVDPVQPSGGVVHGQADRLVDVFVDEDDSISAVQTRAFDLRHGADVTPVQ